jgi:hypothetical protein
VTGEYPTPTGDDLYQIDAKRNGHGSVAAELALHAGGSGGLRTYEC